MPRGSRHLDEPTLYIHPDTDRQRTATTKVEAVQLEADGFRPAPEVQDARDAEARSEAAKRAAATRAKNAAAAAKASKKAAAKPASPVETPTGDIAAGATAIETTEPNSGSGE